jgi:hypothetical protein
VVYHSDCIFNPTGNDKQVTAYVNGGGFVSINDYHEKCKQKSKYQFMRNICNKNIYAFFMSNSQTAFEQTEETFDAVLDDHAPSPLQKKRTVV